VVNEGVKGRPVAAAVLSDVFFALVEFLLAAFEVTFASVYVLGACIVFWGGVVEGIRVERVGRCEGVLCELGHY